MEKAKKNGQSAAFPDDSHQVGLTKREYFVGLAMQGVLATDNYNDDEVGKKALAKKCVGIADALLEQLEETK